jgi:plastocyanin
MTRRTALISAATLAVLAAACGGGSKANRGGGDGGGGGAPCRPTGTIEHITAKNIAFNTTCMAAPAGQAFVINFENQDAGTSHTVSIYTDANASTTLFKGDVVVGPVQHTYRVSPLKAGTYFFRCDIHPDQMNGTFVVAAG